MTDQPGNGFLEALNMDNVKVFTEEMREITEKGFVDSDGNEYEVDVIVCATGFNTSWIPRFPVEANGHSIAKMWAKEASSYISLGVPYSGKTIPPPVGGILTFPQCRITS